MENTITATLNFLIGTIFDLAEDSSSTVMRCALYHVHSKLLALLSEFDTIDAELNRLKTDHLNLKYRNEQLESDCTFYQTEIKRLKNAADPDMREKMTAALNKVAVKHNIGIPEDMFASIVTDLLLGRFIFSIKQIRTLTGWSLMPSKEFIEDVQYEAGANTKD